MIVDAMVFTNGSHFLANRYNECNAKQETTSSLSSIKSAAGEEILKDLPKSNAVRLSSVGVPGCFGVQVIPRRSNR